ASYSDAQTSNVKGRLLGIVPGDIFTDLHRNGIIPDPLFGDNHLDLRWVASDNWTYTKSFEVDKDILMKTYGHEVPPVCPPVVYHGECHPNFIRKAQYSFSWDWGPSFPTVGIWKHVDIIAFDGYFIDDFTFTAERSAETWLIKGAVKAFVEQKPVRVGFKIRIEELHVVKDFEFNTTGGVEPTVLKFDIKIPSEKIELWWPNGQGNQKLYSIILESGEQKILHQLGFRYIELIQDYVDVTYKAKGRHFYFKVNDRPIFLKGSNWIPISNFLSANHSVRLEFLLDSAAEAGMNALRVWGGGVYESEEFYSLADQKGILIWQDLMFACALYPTDESFLNNVKTELTQQIWRIKRHASILVWAGNNENELAIRSHWWDPDNFSGMNGYLLEQRQVHDYVKLYSGTIKPLVEAIDSSRPFLLSSPSNGIRTEEEGGVALTPDDQRYGDIHFYDEFANLWRDNSEMCDRVWSAEPSLCVSFMKLFVFDSCEDLMFACALYPIDENFLTNVRTELTQQVCFHLKYFKLRVEQKAMNFENGYLLEQRQVHDYVKLYSGTIKPLVEAIDSSRPFLLSSPKGGVALTPDDQRYGDIHFYDEFANLWRDSTYQIPRCATEYGVQSLPFASTMLKHINSSEWSYMSQQLRNRQHHPGGVLSNLVIVFTHFPIPFQCTRSISDLHRCPYVNSPQFVDRFAYYSQAHQAITYKTQTEHYRRFRNLLTASGLGNTMCALYWQLNDVWAAPTWSSIDMELKWKMYAVGFNDIGVTVVNDSPGYINEAKLVVDMLAWNSEFEPIYTDEEVVKVEPFSAKEIDLSLGLSTSDADFLLRARLFANNGDSIAPETVLFPEKLYEVMGGSNSDNCLKIAKIVIQVDFDKFGDVTISEFKQIDQNTYKLTINTTSISPFTWISIRKPFLGWFSDNGFTMTAPTRQIILNLKEPVELDVNDFNVCNLKNCGML
ncbi:unnamed protein product, partial [Strongylus vulgaris]